MTLKIKKIHFNQLRNHEHFQCHTEIKSLIERFDSEKMNLEPLFSKTYIPAYNGEDEALVKIIKSILTEKKEDADRQRDLAFKGLTSSVKLGLIHFNDDVVESCRELKILLDRFGNVAKLPLQEETSAIYNLLQELKGTYSHHVQKIKLDSWVNKLEHDNTEYEALVKSNYDEQVLKTELKAKETRAVVDEAFKKIIERIEALIVIEGDANYIEFVRLLNVVLEKHALVLAQRKGISTAKKEKEV